MSRRREEAAATMRIRQALHWMNDQSGRIVNAAALEGAWFKQAPSADRAKRQLGSLAISGSIVDPALESVKLSYRLIFLIPGAA